MGLAIYDGAAEVSLQPTLTALDPSVPQPLDLRAPYNVTYPSDPDHDHLNSIFEENTVVKFGFDYTRLNYCEAATLRNSSGRFLQTDTFLDWDSDFRDFGLDGMLLSQSSLGDNLSMWEEMRGFVIENGPTVRDPLTGAEVRLAVSPFLLLNQEGRTEYYPAAEGHKEDTRATLWPGAKQIFMDVEYDAPYQGLQSMEYMLGVQPISVDRTDPAQRDLCREGVCDISKVVNFLTPEHFLTKIIPVAIRTPALRVRQSRADDSLTDTEYTLGWTPAVGRSMRFIDFIDGSSLPLIVLYDNILYFDSTFSDIIRDFESDDFLQKIIIHEARHKLTGQGHAPNISLRRGAPISYLLLAEWVEEHASAPDLGVFYPMIQQNGQEPNATYDYYIGWWGVVDIYQGPLPARTPYRFLQLSPLTSNQLSITTLGGQLDPIYRLSAQEFLLPLESRSVDDARGYAFFVAPLEIGLSDPLDRTATEGIGARLDQTDARVPTPSSSYRNWTGSNIRLDQTFMTDEDYRIIKLVP